MPSDRGTPPICRARSKPPGRSARASPPARPGEVRDAVETALDLLDKGKVRVAEKSADGWVVNQWLKKAVLLSFRLNDMEPISGAPGGSFWWDKVPPKFAGMTADDFKQRRLPRRCRAAIVRRSAYIAPGVVLLPSFVNLGAYVDSGTMVDTWATVGSCAQIGKNCHISGGAGIGGVLEPLQAGPVIIEDNCFIGARAEVAEGVHRGRGLGAVDGRLSRRLDHDHRPRHRREVLRQGAALFGRGVRLDAGQEAAAQRRAGPQSLLRRHRQARRRKDALQDLDQRAAARLRFCSRSRNTLGALSSSRRRGPRHASIKV